VSRRTDRLGRRGEWAALALLTLKGYRLRHRGWTCPLGELDLVMSRGRTVVIVEVKTRSGPDFGGAAAAVHRRKQDRLARVTAAYLSRFELWDRATRFDVVTIERRGGLLPWRLSHLRNVIRPDLGRTL
jgi:putative endonuclease